MKRALVVVVGLLVFVILAVLVIGFLRQQNISRPRTLKTKQSPQVIWDVIIDHANEPKWRDDVTSVTSVGELNGKPVWQESYKDGKTIQLATTESKSPTRIVREIAEEGPFRPLGDRHYSDT